MSSVVSDVLRQFWTPKMHNVAGPLRKGLGAWICDENYLVNLPLQTNQAVLLAADTGQLTQALAFDCTRMAAAAFESQMQAQPAGHPPKAISWKIIQSYYSAFFAAHAIMRFFGESCS